MRPGQVEIRRYRDGECFETIVAENAIKQNYMELLAEMLDPNTSQSPRGPNYFAVGASATPPEGELSGSTLSDERFRDAIDSTSTADNGRTIEHTCDLGGTEANGFEIAEVGLVDDTNAIPVNRIVLDPADRFIKQSGETEAFRFRLGLRPEEDYI